MTKEYVGQRMTRTEDPRLLTGQALFVDDVQIPGMLHAAFLRSDYRFAPDDDGSVLAVCWFVEELKDSMQELIDDLMETLDWCERARPFNYDWF